MQLKIFTILIEFFGKSYEMVLQTLCDVTLFSAKTDSQKWNDSQTMANSVKLVASVFKGIRLWRHLLKITLKLKKKRLAGYAAQYSVLLFVTERSRLHSSQEFCSSTVIRRICMLRKPYRGVMCLWLARLWRCLPHPAYGCCSGFKGEVFSVVVLFQLEIHSALWFSMISDSVGTWRRRISAQVQRQTGSALTTGNLDA